MDEHPVLVLGAGINGASAARELALNGVPVWVVDDGDVASGATSKSSRLIHGGVRYLEYGEIRLVREALAERERLLRLAPQFVRPLAFALPARRRLGGWVAALPRFFGWSGWRSGPRGMWLINTGLWFYDALARRSMLPRHHVRRAGHPGTPAVDPAEYRWLCVYSDAQMWFPERYTLALLHDAATAARAQGIDFRVLTYQEVRRDGPVIEMRKQGAQEVQRCEPPVVVNACGAWGDATLRGLQVESRQLFGGTKGSHFLTSHRGLLEALAGYAVYAETRDGRFVFIIPYEDRVLVGTTDLPIIGDPRDAVATPEEVDYLIHLVGDVFPQVRLTRDDVECHYCGVRPLPASDAANPSAVTRDHRIEMLDGRLPVLTLVGGKLTTSRQLGEQTADLVLERLGRRRTVSTRDRTIPGGEQYPADQAALDEACRQLARAAGCEPIEAQRLWSLYGSRAAEVIATLAADTSHDESSPTRIGPFSRELVRWIVRNEWVHRADDIIARRLMLVLTDTITAELVEQVVDVLVAEGRIPNQAANATVCETIARLHHEFGCKGLTERP